MTQTNSRKRIKNDTIGEKGLELLFEQYGQSNVSAFRVSCINMINASTGSAETKSKFVTLLENASSKDKLLTTTTNYILAGQGLGV